MVLLRYLYVVALVLWVGGLVVAGALVAPSVFGVLQAWNAAEGRVLAGQVFGEVLLRLTWLSYAMGGGDVRHADAASPARRAAAQVRRSRRHHGVMLRDDDGDRLLHASRRSTRSRRR